jgi:DNA repair protein RadA/Sms
LVGHVTKDGSIAGPRLLEHLVDVVVHFEGERNSRFRMVRAIKNRFGPVDEVGCFDLTAQGIEAITDPSGIFVGTHDSPPTGTCVAVTMEGRRPMVAEVQALVTECVDRPKRTSSGVDGSRLAMIIAVLTQRCRIPLAASDVFAATVGGAKVIEPAADLALAVAMASAAFDQAPPRGLVAVGEIGLAGELRRVPDLDLRLAEAARLGFTRALVPAAGRRELPDRWQVEGLTVVAVRDLAEGLIAARLQRQTGGA